MFSLHHRPVQGEERGAGKGGSAVAGDSGQGVEEGGRADRKIQLELAPPAQEVTEKEKNGQEIKPDAEGVRSISPQQTDDVPQIRSPMDKRSPSGNFIANHIIIGRPGFQFKDENRSKGIKI